MKKKLLVLAITLSVALVLIANPVMAAKDVQLCYVDIGDTTSETGHNLDGWGDPQGTIHVGGYGGIDDCRVIWESSTSDRSATITLDRCVRPGAATCINLRHLDGLADDSFIVEVKDVHNNWVQVGSYTDELPIVDTEEWFTLECPLPNGKELQLDRGRAVEVRITATGDPWGGINNWGQVAFDWIELVGNGKK